MENPMPQRSAARAARPQIPYYKTVKNALDNVVEDANTFDIINRIVIAVHHHAIYTLDFLKAYCLHCCDNHILLPIIDQNLIVNIMAVLVEKTNPSFRRGGRLAAPNAALRARLCAFYDARFASLVPGGTVFEFTNLLQIWKYFGNDVVKDYENNIKQHFVEYVQRFINVLFNKKAMLENMHTQQEKAVFTRHLQTIKQMVLERKPIAAFAPQVAQILAPHLPYMLPQHAMEMDSVYYDLKVHPQAYLPPMVYMMRLVESRGQTIYNVFPMRNRLVPGYIRLDTACVIRLLLTTAHLEQLGISRAEVDGAVKDHAYLIWAAVFKTQKSCFANHNKHYTFAFQLQTNGVAVSILWRDKWRERAPSKCEAVPKEQEVYIDDVAPGLLRDKTFVGIDPNKGDLIYCSALVPDADGEVEHVTFRYTQDQRRKETKKKLFAKRHERLKAETQVTAAGHNVQNREAYLSQFNRKTLGLASFLEYLKAKYKVYQVLAPFYEQATFRKTKWHTFINTQRSEAKMINRFKEKFGPPDEVVIGIGDWEQKRQMKYKEPTKGIGMRRLLRKAKYTVLLVDEHGTSCHCHTCALPHARCETFRTVENPRPWRRSEQPLVKRHGLVKCMTCSRLWNRDTNSSLNILRLMAARRAGEERPAYLQRGQHHH
jgi:hypothetical protein